MSIQSLILLLFIGLMAGRVSSVWAVALIDDSIRTGLRRCDSCKQPFAALPAKLQTDFGPSGPLW
jgi:hypothetical protein